MSTRKEPKWTIMVYLAGDNDLPTFCISILQQLEAVKYPDDVCVLACFDSSVPWTKGSRYFRINCAHRRVDNAIDWEIHNDLVVPDDRRRPIQNAEFGNLNGEDDHYRSRPVVSKGLDRFVEWATKTHPDSERYMLILFGHGLAVGGQNFLISENPPSFLRVQDLQQIIGEHFKENKLDILALQNCVMNGVEMAFALKGHTDFMVGSQDLVLASGWPYEKLISAIVEDTEATTPQVAEKMLKACARNMLDFSIMARSSEQSVVDLNALHDLAFVEDVRRLAEALMDGLHFEISKEVETLPEPDPATGKEVTVKNESRVLSYPAIVDATRLARLEAQAFWRETYVDLFDFCERLLKRCNDVVKAQAKLLKDLGLEAEPQPKLRKSPLVATAKRIIDCCKAILEKEKRIVPLSYQIGPELQYSRGISIYFPWTLPDAPYVAIPQPDGDGTEFTLKTAYATYKDYEFVQSSRWAEFLRDFFLATLRNVRRNSREFPDLPDGASLELGLVGESYGDQLEVTTGDLARTSPDTARTSPDTSRADSDSFSIKNYPRRRYLSPVDWDIAKTDAHVFRAGTREFPNPKSPPVSALGWNLSGLVAAVIEKKSAAGNGRQNGGSKDVAHDRHTDKRSGGATEPPGDVEPPAALGKVVP